MTKSGRDERARLGIERSWPLISVIDAVESNESGCPIERALNQSHDQLATDRERCMLLIAKILCERRKRRIADGKQRKTVIVAAAAAAAATAPSA